MVDIYRDAKRRGIFLAQSPDPKGDSCFSIYQNNGKKYTLYSKYQYNVKLFLARALLAILTSALKSTWIPRITEANQSSRKWISVALVNTKNN